MPGAAPSLKRFARRPHAVQHQDGATATRAVRAMTPVRKGIGHPADGLSPWDAGLSWENARRHGFCGTQGGGRAAFES
jgi:hypothetical protein